MEEFVSLFADKLNFRLLSSSPHLSFNIVKKYPDANWDWQQVSRNPGIHLEDTLECPEFPWVLREFSANPSSTLDLLLKVAGAFNEVLVLQNKRIPIEEILEKTTPTSQYVLSARKDLTVELIRKYPNIDWYWTVVTLNIHEEEILSHPELQWSESALRQRTNISEKFKKAFPKLFRQPFEKLTSFLEEHPEVKSEITGLVPTSFSLVLQYPCLPWNWCLASRLPDLDFGQVQENCQLPWDKEELSKHPDLSLQTALTFNWVDWDWFSFCAKLEEVLLNPSLPWSGEFLCSREDMTTEVALQLPGELRDWDALSEHCDFRGTSDLPWNFGIISKREDVSLQDVINLPEVDWNWEVLSRKQFKEETRGKFTKPARKS